MGIEDKNETILNLERQLREKSQQVEQVNRSIRPVIALVMIE